jgi:SAM-dependent methyltransferase
MHTGFVGGALGYHLLRLSSRLNARPRMDGSAYRGRSKLEVLLGPGIWESLRDKVVVDFGCGTGEQAIEIAGHGARRVIGLDIRQSVLDIAASRACDAGVADRCEFTLHAPERADAVISIDGFEHYDDPAGILRNIEQMLEPDGRVFVAFGPPWFHPLGGHLFSVFPWAHLIFTEPALIRWRAGFKTDGARRFGEVEGGLNQMTVRRFERLVAESGLRIDRLDAIPIRRLRRLANRWTREMFTSTVRCTLVPGGTEAARRASV